MIEIRCNYLEQSAPLKLVRFFLLIGLQIFLQCTCSLFITEFRSASFLTGTFHGFGATCIAHALPADGSLLTLESDINSFRAAKQNFEQLPDEVARRIQILHTKAADYLRNRVTMMQHLPASNQNAERFDFIYVDADKLNYRTYYDLIVDNQLLSKNGVMLIDNVLWKGIFGLVGESLSLMNV
jgi:caffeoyl-CoA O-methyltransferase